MKNLAEEYLQDVNDNEYMHQFVREDRNQGQDSGKKEKQSNGFVVKGTFLVIYILYVLNRLTLQSSLQLRF